MMRKKFHKKLQVLTALAVLSGTLTMTGCTQTKESHGEITVLCKAQNVQFWDYVEKGAVDCGEEMGYTIHYEETKNDTELGAQRKMVEDAISRKTLAIVIAPNDVSGLNDVLSKAVSEGIPIITIDSDVSFEDRISYIGSDNLSAGAIEGRAVKNILPDGGEVAIIGHGETSQTAIQRIQGLREVLEDQKVEKEVAVGDEDNTQKTAKIYDEKYPIKKIEHCDNDIEKANKLTKEILQKYPDVKVICGTNENSTTGICNAVTELGKSGSVQVVGFNSSQKEIEYLKDGTLAGTIVQNPYNMGYLGVKYAISAVNGEEENLTNQLITSVTLVTADNLNNEDIEFLINPIK